MKKFSSVIRRENGFYIAHCPELDIASQGKTENEAEENLREAIKLYLEDKDSLN